MFILMFLCTIGIVNSQELSGIWISNDYPLQNGSNIRNSIDGKTILDFDAYEIGFINSDRNSTIASNRKNTRLKIKGVRGKLKIEHIGQNKMVLKGSKNRTYVFDKLVLSHKLNMGEKELSDFLVDQQCDLIQGIQGKFTKEQFFLDKKAKKAHRRNQFINFSQRVNGYWYMKTIKGNTFFIFDSGQNKTEDIFQILSMKVNGFKLLPLQEDNSMKGLTWLKTCL